MAVLEKIRRRQVLLFSVIIVALFLFIISLDPTLARTVVDLFTGDSATTMVKVGKNKVDHDLYRRTYDAQQDQYKQMVERQRRSFDNAEYEQYILNQLMYQKLLEEQYDKLGINVTDKEITKAMSNQHPLSAQFFQYLAYQLGRPDMTSEQILFFINNPSQSPFPQEALDQIKALWAQQEQGVEEQIKQTAFNKLVSGLFTSNNLDAKALFSDNMDRLAMSYVTMPIGFVNDSIAVSDDELRAEWNDSKAKYYSAEPRRVIEYITVPIVPSQDDLNKAIGQVLTAQGILKTSEGLEGLPSNFTTQTFEMPASNVKSMTGLYAIPDSVVNKAGSVYRAPYNAQTHTHTMAKILNVANKVDSINYSMYVYESAAEADSIKALLANGATFKDLAENNAGKAVDNQWIVVNGANNSNVPANIKSFMLDNPTGKTLEYSDSTTNMTALIQLNERLAPKTFVEFALITLDVEPSSDTESNLWTGINSYVASNPKAKLLSQNLDSLPVYHHNSTEVVTPSTPHIGNLDDSRQGIKWAMSKAKVGDVSKVYRTRTLAAYPGAPTDEVYYVVSLKEVVDGDYFPYNSELYADRIAHSARKVKRGQELVAEYQGKANNLEGYAQLMNNATVRTDSTISFNAPRFGILNGTQSNLRGMAAAAKAGELVGPVLGDNEIVVFTVAPVEYNHRDIDYDMDGNTFTQRFGILDPFDMLVGGRKMQNNSLRFVVSDEDRQ